MKNYRKHFSRKKQSNQDDVASPPKTLARENHSQSLKNRGAQRNSEESEDDSSLAVGPLDLTGDYLWTREMAQAVDRKTIEHFGIPELVLMESAGRAIVQVIQDLCEDQTPIIVLAGNGNNGGDALVVARSLINLDYEVHIFELKEADPSRPSSSLSPSRQHQETILKKMGVPVKAYQKGAFRPFQDREPIFVDGIFGVGFKGALSPTSPAWVMLEEVHRVREKTVIAIDVPSGLDCDQGDEQQVPLPADVTVTFGAKKPAHVIAPARDHCGEVVALEIGFPLAAQDSVFQVKTPQWVVPDPDELIIRNPWSRLSRSSHKFDRGHVLVVGGSPGKTGAPLLAGLAALRMGAGWVSVALPSDVQKEMVGDVPRELTFEQLFHGHRLDTHLLRQFIETRKVKALVIGPGMVESPLSPEVLEELAALSLSHGVQVTFDAGACQGLIPMLMQCHGYPHLWVATPHPGEWVKMGFPSLLTPLALKGSQELQKCASEWGISLLYKHATPIFLAGDTHFPAFVTAEGTNALARAGSGDLLAGMIGAHGAMGLRTPEAVLRSLVVLAWAAKLAARKRGGHGVLARDILDHMGRVDLLLDEEDEDRVE